jgi:three-Cys-motif partner protein
MASGHRFGGGWTDLKLGVLQDYLAFFTTALRKQKFELLYIDGFAGSGGRIVERVIARGSPLFGTLDESENIDVPGSARIALETKPPFHRIVLIERHNRRFAELKSLCSHYPDVEVLPLQGEANEAITNLCRSQRWRASSANYHGIRAVLFLDPYGMNVNYSTLGTIAETKAIDVWYLFPLSGVYRQAARSGHKLTTSKRAAITRILGTDEWESAFYSEPKSNDLFANVGASRRTADVSMIEVYVKSRLENIFPRVTKPLRLSMKNGAPLYSLFFAMSNSDPKAIGLALKGANHILKSGISSQTRPRN